MVGGASLNAAFSDGSIELNPVVTVDFIRGDANNDARVNIADGVWIINELFLGGPANPCPISSDSNADGNTDAGDPFTSSTTVSSTVRCPPHLTRPVVRWMARPPGGLC